VHEVWEGLLPEEYGRGAQASLVFRDWIFTGNTKQEKGGVMCMCDGWQVWVEEAERTEGPEVDSNGTWAINGCCGGGCYVLAGMTHCPFCGSELQEEEDDSSS